MTNLWIRPFLIVIFGFFVRILYAFFSHDFWFDEAFNYFIAQNNIGGILHALSYDNWPPLYTLLMGFWQKIASSAFLIRLPSVIFGTLTLPTIWAVGKILFNRKVANISLLLASFSPPLVYFSSENRPFALFGLLATLTILTYLKLSKKPSLGNLFFFTATGIASLYTHYFGILAIGTLIVSGYFSKRWRVKFSYLLASILMMALFFSPWLIASLKNPKPACLCLGPIWGLGATLAALSFGGAGVITQKRIFEVNQPILQSLYLAFILIINLMFAYSLRFLQNPNVRLLLSYLAIPLIITFLISFYTPLFSLRSFIFLVPIYLATLAFSFNQLAPKLKLRWLLVFYLTFSSFILITTSQRIFFNYEPLAAMSQVLKSYDKQNIQIIHSNLYTYLPARFYAPSLHQKVLSHDLPEPLLTALNPQLLATLDNSKPTLLVYALDRTDNRQLQKLLLDLYNAHEYVGETRLNQIRILIFK